MILKNWDQLPDFLRTEEVRPYYDILARRKGSLLLKRCFDVAVSAAMLVLLCPVFLILAAAIMCSYNNTIKAKLTLPGLLLLLMTGLFNGTTDFSQKMIVKSFPQVPNAVFNFYTYVFAIAALLIAFIFLRLRFPGEGGDLAVGFRKALPLLLIMAATLFGSSFFKTEAAKHLDAAVLFPLTHGCTLILSSAMAALFFKEKITWRSILGLSLIFIAMVIINF